jgi:hypothetical protein
MKVWWACRVDPAKRYGRLAEVAAKHRLQREAEFWTASQRAIVENTSASRASRSQAWLRDRQGRRPCLG